MVVEEGRLEPCLPHLGLQTVASYSGLLLREGEAGGDDGSSPAPWAPEGRRLYLSQQEWASSGGLGMKGGQVQVSSHKLITQIFPCLTMI